VTSASSIESSGDIPPRRAASGESTAVGEFLASDERGKRIPEYLTSLGDSS